jgi:hypothetical protein
MPFTNSLVRAGRWICAFAALALGLAIHAQAPLNPPHLADFPDVDRVLREIQGSDPTDAAKRQMGAFWQMRKVLYDLATRNPGEGTPDEERIANAYYVAYSELQKKFSLITSRYDVDPDFRDEVFDKFFSPGFRPYYLGKMGIIDARIQAREAANIQAQKDAIAAQEAAAAAEKDPGTEAARRCVASGRNPMECITAAIGGGFNELLGMAKPDLKQAPPTPGLRVNGVYPGPGDFSLVFRGEAVTVACGAIIPAPHAYTVEARGSQATVTVENVPKPFVLTFRPDGSLTGPGLTSNKGRVVAGSRSGTRYFSDGTSTPITETIYADAIVECNVGKMTATGPAPPSGGVQLLSLLPGAEQAGLEAANSQQFKPTPGLRMAGVYAAPSGLSIEFHDDSAVLTCRQALIARAYDVDLKPGQASIRIAHQPAPLALNLAPNGTLSGAGSVRIDGRQVVGFSDATNQVVYASSSDTCALGTLSLSTGSTQ